MNPYLEFGPRADPVAWAALVLALLLLGALGLKPVRQFFSGSGPQRSRWLVPGLAVCAVILSAGYVAHYLHGGPRIVDATHYFLEARALSRGYFAFPVPDPEASFGGRFLVAAPSSGRIGVLFPPGYPLLLAAAFRLHAPLALGPALAGALVIATYALGRSLGCDQRTASVAAGLSLLCAALRYHTADTMSHGLSALLGALSILTAARNTRFLLVLSGFFLGWLIATRPVTGAVFLFAQLAFAGRQRLGLVWLFPGILPGICLLLAHQQALTGSFFSSTQLAYYAHADGPPGCMRYGFGHGIGCWFEHGDYVRARLPNGYGLVEAAATSLRRLAVHSLDVANAAPLSLGVPLGMFFGRRERGPLLAGTIVLGVMGAYAPFYFEGSFPGGGARFFADVLPLEHVLVARALAELRIARFAWPVALGGFGLHTHTQHSALSAREGGRPMFEPAVLRDAGVERGLIFVSTDHGFALGHEPGTLSTSTDWVVARRRHDGLDRLLWERLGRPPTYSYDYSPDRSHSVPLLTRMPIAPEGPTLRLEAESFWPPARVSAGWSHPDYAAETCASRGRGLRLRPTNGTAKISLVLPRLPRRANLVVGWLGASRLDVSWRASSEAGKQRLEASSLLACSRSERITTLPSEAPIELELSGPGGLVDYFELQWQAD